MSALFALFLAAAPAPSEAAVLAFRPAPGDETKYQRHFYFHRQGVALDAARADIVECRGYAAGVVLWARLPDRVPAPGKEIAPQATGSGIISPLVAGAVLDIFGGAEERKIVGANLRKCMGFKGYRRYGLSEPLWEWLNAGDDAVDRQARIASGPAPAAKWLDP